MNDLISRQAAIDALHMHLMYRMGTDSNKKRLDEWINNLPSAQPEQRWIPCSERLPEEYDSIFNRFYGTERFTKAMRRKQSDEVIVTELFEDGTMRTSTACTHDGEWHDGIKFVKREIIAWMPLPEPYQEERRTDD